MSRLRKSYYLSQQAIDLLEGTKTVQGFWGAAKGNASESQVVDYIIVDYLTNNANMRSCKKCSAWLEFSSNQVNAGDSYYIECPKCGQRNDYTVEVDLA